MRLEPRTLVAAHLSSGPQPRSLETLDPFDRNRFADPKALRSAPTAHAAMHDCLKSPAPANPENKVRPFLLASIQPAG